jgi:pimeloyl-ACP methyl ester carboxylesterase
MVAGGGYAYIRHQLFARVEGQYFDSNGVQIHYTDEGTGDPVILLHGFSVNADIQWRRPGLHQAFVKEFRVITMDNRGHGLSGKPHDPAAYGTEFCDDIIRLMDHLGIEKAAVAGYSMGGMITMKLIATHPDRLVCAAPCAYGWAQESPESQAPLAALVESLEAGKGLGPLFELLTPLNEPMPDPGRTAQMDAYLQAINDQQALAALIRSWPQMLVTAEQLQANQVPVMEIIGANDPLRVDVDRMNGVMNNLRIVYIPDTNHMNAITPEFIQTLSDFIQENYAAERENTTEPLPAAA